MSQTEILVGPMAAVAAALTGAGPDPALDALIHAVLTAPGGDVTLAEVVRLSDAAPSPLYTADARHARAAAAERGILALSGSDGERGWASFWLPAPDGEDPIMMFASDEPRAASAALAKAVSMVGNRVLQSFPGVADAL